jgi:hypothetical protein
MISSLFLPPEKSKFLSAPVSKSKVLSAINHNQSRSLMKFTKNACVPFPLSFDTHRWYITALKGDTRINSNLHEFSIDDLPLSDVPENARLLRQHWKVASSLSAGTDGRLLTSQKTNTRGWATTSLPATVLTALVRNGIYTNPYYGMNNMLIPDASDEYNAEYTLGQYSLIPGVNPWKQSGMLKMK